MQIWATRRGFTIVELIVTITVIAILAAIVTISYNGVQQSTRDSQRKNDVTQIKIALEKYFAANSRYPGPSGCAANTACNATTYLASPLSPYLQNFPTDPSGSAYEYAWGGTSGNAFAIRVPNEATAVCKTGVRVETLTISAWSSLPTC